jgi:uncharacterized protein (DUF488 family)
MTAGAAGNAGNRITLFTIGFAGKSAEEFFGALARAGVKRVVDIRLNNVSQLAGFTKKQDLPYLLRALAGIEYAHEPGLAPAKDILDDYKKKRIDWAEYERRYNALLDERRPEASLRPEDFDRTCLLCSEADARQCHRRLAAEHFARVWEHVEVRHL